MVGLVTHRAGREYRIPTYVIISLVNQERFSLEGTGHIFSFRNIKDDLEYEFVISEFEQPSEQISEENDFSERDYEFEEAYFSEKAQWEYKLQTFRRLETILKEKGII
jgi:hypothetical protein